MRLAAPTSPTVRSVRSLPPVRRSFLLISLTLVTLVVAGALMWSGEEEPAPTKQVTSRQVRIDVLDGPAEQHRVQIDLTMYAPARTPAPAVVLAHGFGGDKTSLTGPARNLAERGFTVLTYSARGFGNSTGKIALNSPEYEVTDARQILDWLARQPEVVTDGENDPLVGVAGVSYGGALSLLLAGSDPRVDAIAPVMAYNDLSRALLPDAASAEPIPSDTPARGAAESAGVFKKSWAARLFATGTGGPGTDERSRPDSEGDMARGPRSEQPVTCGNFTSEVCAAYTELAESGSASRRTLDLLAAASPRSVTDDIDIPTLLVQGQQDPLFGLSQADANARQIAAAGGKVKMIWFAGGNDSAAPGPRAGGPSETGSPTTCPTPTSPPSRIRALDSATRYAGKHATRADPPCTPWWHRATPVSPANARNGGRCRCTALPSK